MTGFFQFKHVGATQIRTPLQTVNNAVNPAQAIANRKITEIRVSQASSSGIGSPSRVISAHPLRTVVDLEGSLLTPSQGVLPADTLWT